MFAAPVPGDPLEGVRVGLIEGGITNDPHTRGEWEGRSGLGPEGGGIRFEAMEPSGERIGGGRIGRVGRDLGRVGGRDGNG